MSTRDLASRLRLTAREIVIVVVSILIAFGLDAWWDAVQASGERDDILAGLLRDFESNAEQLAFRLQENQRGQRNSELLLEAFELGNGGIVLLPDSLVAAPLLPPTYDPVSGTLDGLLASRGLDVLQSPELAQRLTAWLKDVGDNAEDERRAVELVPAITVALGRTESPRKLLDSLFALAAGDHLSGTYPVDTGDHELQALIALRAFHFANVSGGLAALSTTEAELVLLLRDALEMD